MLVEIYGQLIRQNQKLINGSLRQVRHTEKPIADLYIHNKYILHTFNL